jgi:SEC-C motif-containing protein
MKNRDENKKKIKCPCGSGELYKNCCELFHRGKPPENALELMRSRYSAYALNLPGYIIQTTHPENPHFSHNIKTWAKEISDFCLLTQFKKLEILEFQETKDVAFVTFVAHLMQKGQDATFTEKSRFAKVQNRWLYQSGEIWKGKKNF